MDKTYSKNVWPSREQTWLLKACLFSGSDAKKAWDNWTNQVIFDKIDPASYNLLPLVSRNEELYSLEDPLFEKCKGVYRQTWVLNHLHWEKTLPVLSQLLKVGIDKIVLLKGMAMILHYYKDFGVRVIGDVDILIQKAQLPIAGPLLYASGWKQTVSRFDLKNREHLSRWHALNFTHPSGMDLDLHWSLIQENSLAIDKAVWGDLESLPIKNVPLHIPKPTDLLLQTCVHGVKHSPVSLIRWIADAMTLLKQKEKQIDWERLVDLAQKAKVSLPLSSALQYLSKEFGAPIPQVTIQKLQATSPTRIEQLEYRANVRGSRDVAAWYRYCLNRGYLTMKSRLFHLHQYLQCTARLKFSLLIPFFAPYWILKHFARMLSKFQQNYTARGQI